jgi:hypothetical protein
MCPWELTFKILEENKKIYWQNHHIGLLQHSIFFWLVKEHSLRYDMSRGRPGPRAVALVMAQETPSIPCLFLAHILHKSAQQTAPSSHPGRLGHSNCSSGSWPSGSRYWLLPASAPHGHTITRLPPVLRWWAKSANRFLGWPAGVGRPSRCRCASVRARATGWPLHGVTWRDWARLHAVGICHSIA